jgi:hypothetical protein
MATPGYKMIGPDGRESVEFDSDALISYARQGYVQQFTNVFDPTSGQWMPASQIGVLQGAFVSQPWAAPAPQYGIGYGSKPKSSMRSTLTIALIAGLLSAVVAFLFLSRSLFTGKKTVTSADGKYGVSVPIFWRHSSTSDSKMVSYYYAGGYGVQIYSLIRHPVTDAQLDAETKEIEHDALKNNHTDHIVSEAVPLTVGGYPARQFLIDDDGSAAFGGYAHRRRKTLIATQDGVYDVSIYCRVGKFDSETANQSAILYSFHKASAPGQ